MIEALDTIRVVLVNTSHPGNIGSAARAMKTMGLRQLYLVAPVDFPSQEAFDLASGAREALHQAVVVNTLQEAIGDCEWVIGASARVRDIKLNEVTPRESALKALSLASKGAKVALVFGRERTGLYNEELHLCHQHAIIPANPDYSSLNLAQAVQVFCYECRIAALASFDAPAAVTESTLREDRLATVSEVDGFIAQLEQVMIATQFLDPLQPKKLLPRLRRLFCRCEMELREVNILRGVLTAINKTLSKGR